MKFYDTLIADYGLTAIIDLTAADGTLMTHRAKERIPYFGFCLTECHATLLKTRVVQQVLESMFTPGERECDLELVAMMTPKGHPAQTNEPSKTGTDTGTGQSTLTDFQEKLKQFKAMAEKSPEEGSGPKKARVTASKNEEADSPDE